VLDFTIPQGEPGSGSGTVTSVGLTLPGELSVSGSPVTASGTLTAAWASQDANLVFAGPASGAAAAPTMRALVDADIPATLVRTSAIGAVSGVASLDSGGHIPSSQLPAAILGQVSYQGTWDATGAAPTSTPSKGQYWIVSVAGSTSLGGITDWNVGDWAIYDDAWDKVDNTDAISSWNGRTGAITPASGDYTFSQIGSTPTTLSGYGITDAQPNGALSGINSQAGTSYTLALTDAGKLIRCSNASAIALTVPPNSAVALPIGTQILFSQDAAGVVTAAAGSGVNGAATTAQYDTRGLLKIGTDEWWVA
jgi:hypothetical protein